VEQAAILCTVYYMYLLEIGYTRYARRNEFGPLWTYGFLTETRCFNRLKDYQLEVEATAIILNVGDIIF